MDEMAIDPEVTGTPSQSVGASCAGDHPTTIALKRRPEGDERDTRSPGLVSPVETKRPSIGNGDDQGVKGELPEGLERRIIGRS